ncbi:pyrimidine 5'-nucleotidase [Deferribacter desulfuricans SSM1]|uniref:Pyrimidine 5'-nucleotidase n=1 Tax=Deferribacter desulfuricans (strain DSM 14783 / JCM 11476 / NBRC 101012 / SSM1) TaxID=639282 RepID=D3P8R6_DEFDS|nr:pyrimidine 5'-nucleotidase [Deferribacter desulfuricans]BAI81106.1 pyrimidine 5'-nucleotidase [Deferribacter desulfuricans SSM1]
MSNIKYLVFDLDNTLYPPDKSILKEVDKKINEFMVFKVGISSDDVDSLRREYWDKYGTTLNGLIKHFNINPHEYLEFVHDVCYDKYFCRDDLLIKILSEFDEKKYIFTNGSKKHALNVLERLGIKEYFEQIFSIEDTDFHPKPYKKSFDFFVERSGINPKETIFFEDMPKNLRGAKELGFKTALVWDKSDEFDYAFDSIYDIINIKKIKYV